MSYFKDDFSDFFAMIESRIGLEVSSEQRKRLVEHLELLMEKNQVMNLTAIKDMDQALELHLEDSLLALPIFLSCGPERFCDLGTGGGFPGIPLGIMSGCQGVLVLLREEEVFCCQGVHPEA